MGTTATFEDLLEIIPERCPKCQKDVLTGIAERIQNINIDIKLSEREPYMTEYDNCWGRTINGRTIKIPTYPTVRVTRLWDSTYRFYNLQCMYCGHKFVETTNGPLFSFIPPKEIGVLK